MITNIEIIGYIANILASVNLFPEIYTIIKTQNVVSISYLTYFLNTFYSTLLIIYSLNLKLWPILFGNIMILFTSICIIILKYKYSHNYSHD
jgi:uncharacterized protein with PQ loop repeat